MTSVSPHKKAKALKPSSRRPAKELCSECGLCDTYYIHYVKEACAFINQQIGELEEETHERSRNLDNPDELYFGVHQHMTAARVGKRALRREYIAVFPNRCFAHVRRSGRP